MTQEEKAKAYDAAREKIAVRFGTNVAEEIFSEFEESEDERIRKGLINYFNHHKNGINIFYGIKGDDILAWLEKQAEKPYTFKSIPRLLEMIVPSDRAKSYWQKLINTLKQEGYDADAKIVTDYLKEMNGEKVAMAVQDSNIKVLDEKDYNVIKSIKYLLHELDNHNFDDWFNYILNNDECKPIVVKKFSEGDWIVKKGHVYGGVPVMIKEIGNYLYLCERQDGVIIELNKNDVLKEYKHWDITDAVNGNMLAEKNVILIFKGIGNTEWDDVIDYHCYYDCYRKNFVVQEDINYWGDIKNNQLKPATKEECDLLFSKMEEAGYEWDFWKKRCIKKINKNK